jgi:hypothetical protein
MFFCKASDKFKESQVYLWYIYIYSFLILINHWGSIWNGILNNDSIHNFLLSLIWKSSFVKSFNLSHIDGQYLKKYQICDMIINKLFTWLTNQVQAMELQFFNKY